MTPAQFAQSEIAKKCMAEILAVLDKYGCLLTVTTIYQDGVLAQNIIGVKVAPIVPPDKGGL